MRRKKIMAAVLAMIVAAVPLTGCRETTVLEEIVYSNNAEDIDLEKLEYELERNAERDQEMDKNQIDEDEDKKDQEETDALLGDDDDIASHVSDLTYDSDSETNQAGHSGTDSNENGDAENSNGASGDTGGDNSSTVLNPTNDPANLQQVIDANGNVIKIPKNVDKVSATGTIAAYVEMLGGSGRLVATSTNFGTTSFSSTVYGESVTKLWKGSGDSSLSASDFSKLMAAGPEVCLVENGNSSFTNSQIKQLAAAGITVVTVPRLNTSANIESAVKLIGQILGDKSDKGGEDAEANASDYISWYKGIISKVSGSCTRYAYNNIDYNNDRTTTKVKYINSGSTPIYALFVDSWDSSATYKIFNSDKGTVQSGSGAAATTSGYSSSPLSYLMSLAGVCNVAAAYDDFGTEHKWYVNGLQKGYYDINITGQYTDYTAGLQTCPYLTQIATSDNMDYYNLGSGEFSTIIAASKDVKKNLESSPLTQYYSTEVDTGKGTAHGYTVGGGVQASLISAMPNIIVNPQGASDWYTGSPESPLEAMWISATFGTGISESDLKKEIKNFYKTFYRYNLTDGQVEAILAGN